MFITARRESDFELNVLPSGHDLCTRDYRTADCARPEAEASPAFPIANDFGRVSLSDVLAGDGVQFLNCLMRQLKASASNILSQVFH
jgi:hypothetical protein